MLARGRGVELGEGAEQLVLICSLMPQPLSCTSIQVVMPPGAAGAGGCTCALLGELDGIAHQVQQDVRQRAAVAWSAHLAGARFHVQLQALPDGGRPHCGGGFLDQVGTEQGLRDQVVPPLLPCGRRPAGW
jgi:hypothetical protein